MIEITIVQLTLALVRVASFVAFLPPTNGQSIPKSVKIGLAVVLAVCFGLPETGEASAAIIHATQQWPAFAILAVRESLYGLGLAMCLSLFLMPARMAGAYIAQEMGLSIATLTGPTDGQQMSILGVLLESMATLLFFALNFHLAVIVFLQASFERFQPGTATLEISPGWLIHSVTESIEAGLLIAAPVGIVLMMSLFGSLVLMRSVPQFNLFSVGMGLRLVAGLSALIIFAPEMMVLLRYSLYRMLPLMGG